jgi:transcriptional regulator with XRE-family HTH domain
MIKAKRSKLKQGNSAITAIPKRVALGNWLRQQRQAKGLTMREMQAISGKAHSYFGKIEQALRGLDVLEFIELCGWLGIDAAESINALLKI